MTLNLKVISRLLNKAWEREDNFRKWDLYTAIYPLMGTDNFMSFEEFSKPQIIEIKEEEEILMEVKDVISMFRAGGE